jgi:hypothetical protein
MAAKAAEVDYSKSTMAYPMDPTPKVEFVDSDIDYSKSTGAYPMYDERNAPERVIEHVGSYVADVQFPTPGPVSSGLPDVVAQQRAELGLSSDPSGGSDQGYEARPSTIPVAGADGVDREPESTMAFPMGAAEVETKVAENSMNVAVEPEPEVQAKVVEAPAKKAPAKRTHAATKHAG